MSDRQDSRTVLFVVVALLVVVAGVSITYKIRSLGFSLAPDTAQSVWLLEARIRFNADGGPAKVSLDVPEADMPGFKILDQDVASAGYGFQFASTANDRRIIWSTRRAQNRQTLYYRVEIFDVRAVTGVLKDPIRLPVEPPVWEEPAKTAAEAVVSEARRRSADDATFTGAILRALNSDRPSAEMKLLLAGSRSKSRRLRLAIDLLAMEGIPSRIARGVYLHDGQRHQPLSELLEIHVGQGWIFVEPESGQAGLPENFILWQRGDSPVLEVSGGSNSKVSVSVIREDRAVLKIAGGRVKRSDYKQLAMAIYKLPVSEQNIFRKLMLIPLGALVVVLVRNVIGFKTSGTFMPILIAMAFYETSLVAGLILFVAVVSVGLAIRHYLSRLNLLLVPRISAVVIVVICITTGLSIVGSQFGLSRGLEVMLFPIIVISWTIERLSIAWEEQGAYEAMVQVAGSLFVAVIAYLMMSNVYAEHLVFVFPEINLVVLAVILLLGTYTGYRLTELSRFEPLVQENG